MVTHDARYAALAQRSVRLFDGRIVDEDSFQRLTREDEARLEAMVDLDPGTQP
jgi:putative ABC transport system ATP-binding protein